MGDSGIKTQQGLFDGSQTPAWKKISKHITSKNPDDPNFKEIYESRYMKQQIFDDIYDKFTKGEKLLRYDHYTREQQRRNYEKYLASLN